MPNDALRLHCVTPSGYVVSLSLLRPAQQNSGRRARISFQKFLHQSKRGVIFLLRVRYSAIRGDEQIKIAHVGIVCGEKDAKIPSNAGEN